MSTGRSRVGHEIEAALGEVLAHVRGEVELPCRVIDDPTAERIPDTPYSWRNGYSERLEYEGMKPTGSGGRPSPAGAGQKGRRAGCSS